MADGEVPALGIDLGTTYSCVAVWRHGKVEIIVNEQGGRITPSCVAFDDHQRLVGDGATNQASKNPTNTVFDAKRLIGRRFSEETVQSDMKFWPFKVVAGDNDRPTIVVRHKGQEERFAPEEISSMVLSKMKEIATTFLGRPARKAVVTVPAYFNNSQRQSTKDAGEIAGLDIIHILNEPDAAALAYVHDNKDICSRGGGKKKILVFDLGGGTFDVSLLELDEHGVLDVKAKNGDTHLGGQDFDNRMVDHFLEVFRQKYHMDMSKNAKSVRRLRTECEKAKRLLSTLIDTEINIDSLYDGIDFTRRFSRVKFEELNKDLFDKCLGPLEQCLKDARVGKNEVDEVVLVGGSTRIPRVQELLKDFFNGKRLRQEINADEAVAYGAAIHAASFNKVRDQRNAPEFVLLDVAPLSLGLKNYKGEMIFVIPRNTRIPCEIELVWETAYDYQSDMYFYIYEGERPMAAGNNLLGQFHLLGLRRALQGEIKFLVIFKIDKNGILHVSARNKDNGDKANITITRDKLTLSKEEINKMIRDAKRFENEDNERKKAALAKHKLEDYANKIRNLIQEYRVSSNLSRDKRRKVEYAINEVTEWLEDNDNAPYREFEQRMEALEEIWEPISAMAGIRNLNI